MSADLVKLQTELGASHTYRESEQLFSMFSRSKRYINNHDRIKHTAEKVGAQVGALNHVESTVASSGVAEELIINVDGEHIKAMVNSGVSPCRIRSYLHRWSTWWVGTAQSWQYHELLEWFLHMCWDLTPANYAIGLLHQDTTKAANHDHAPVLSTSGFHAAA